MITHSNHCKFSDIARDNVLELHVNTCNTPPATVNVYDANRADFFAVIMLTEGQAKIRLNLEERSISKNTLLIMRPNTTHQLVDKSDDVCVYSVIFTSSFLLQTGLTEEEMEKMNFSATVNDALALNDIEASRLKKIMKDLKTKNESIHKHPFGEDIVKYSFRIFLSELGAIAVNHQLISIQKTTRKQSIVLQFSKLVNSHFMKNRSVKFYADQLAITPKYLTEIVHEVTGEPASALIDEKVIYETKLLLNNPQLSIAQIAEALNFSDQSFLGKFFKRHLGLSPTQYRNHKLV